MRFRAASGGLLRRFLERNVEHGVHFLRGQGGCVDVAQTAEERKRFGGCGEGEVQVAGGKAFLSHGSHIGKRAVLL
jgi:hypothetical protein